MGQAHFLRFHVLPAFLDLRKSSTVFLFDGESRNHSSRIRKACFILLCKCQFLESLISIKLNKFLIKIFLPKFYGEICSREEDTLKIHYAIYD